MKIKLQNSKINVIFNGLSQITNKGDKLSADTSFAVAFTIDAIQEALTEFDKERKSILDKYAVKGDDGEFEQKEGNINFGDNSEKAEKAFEKLLNKEVEIELDEEDLLTRDKLRKEDKGVITPATIMQLSPFFKAVKNANTTE